MIVKYFIDINLPKMKNFLYFDLMQKVANCLTTDRALGEKYTEFQTAFTTAFRRLDEAMKISRKSLLTPEIQKLDAQRVQEWRIIRSAAHESLKLPGEDKVAAADFVLSLISNHGDIQNMKVTERTGALTNLCQDLTEKYAPQVEAISLAGFAAQLSATNAEYLRLYEQRLHEWSEYKDGEVQAAREQTDATLENLCIMVASGILTEGMTTYKHFVDYVNEVIKVAKIAMGVPTSGSGSSTGGGGSTGGETGGSGSGEGGSTGGSGSTGGGQEEEQEYTVTYYGDNGEVITTQRYKVGQTIVPPAPPAGFEWGYLPTIMPARNLNIYPIDPETGA